MKRHYSLPLSWLPGFVLILWPLLPVASSDAQTVTPSPTLGSLGTRVELTSRTGGQNYDIRGGTRPGGGTNLFHSFGEFGLGAGDAARFLNDMGRPTTNILSRVTGGTRSNISGELSTTDFPGANLYIVNPAGVMFGETATLHVSGTVKVTTANYLRFEDGSRFNAMPGQEADLLSATPVTAFGFLRQARAPIQIDRAQLSTNQVSLIGGDITIENGASLSTSGGRIELVSVAASPGEVRPESDPDGRAELSGFDRVEGSGFQTLGTITIADSHVSSHPITVSGNAGAIEIRGGRLSVQRSSLSASALGTGNAAPIYLQVADRMDLEGSGIGSSSAQGRADSVALDARGSMSLNRTHLASNAEQGGSVSLEVGQVLSVLESVPEGTRLDASSSSTLVEGGTGGSVNIDAQTVVFRGPGSSVVGAKGGERGGSVRINATGNIEMENTHVDVSATNGVAGNIVIEGNRTVTFRSNRVTADGTDGSTGGVGRGGNIFILTGQGGFHSDSSRVRAEALSRSATTAGRIRIFTSADPETPQGPINLRSFTVLSTSTPGNGMAGEIVLSGTTVQLSSSEILSTSLLGNGGRVEIIRNQFINPDGFIDVRSRLGLPGTEVQRQPQP